MYGSRFSGFRRGCSSFLRFAPKFVLDNYGSAAESSTYRGAIRSREYLALALRNLNDGYHSYQRGDTRSRALRFLQFGAVQNDQFTLQKMSQTP